MLLKDAYDGATGSLGMWNSMATTRRGCHLLVFQAVLNASPALSVAARKVVVQKEAAEVKLAQHRYGPV
jgi:hypothetical protein